MLLVPVAVYVGLGDPAFLSGATFFLNGALCVCYLAYVRPFISVFGLVYLRVFFLVCFFCLSLCVCPCLSLSVRCVYVSPSPCPRSPVPCFSWG